MTPLHGIRIADFTMGWAGPLATRHLADLGAEVVKIESARHFDWWRGVDHDADAIAAGAHEKTSNFNHINRNKLGVAIDLATPKGRDLALRIATQVDAVIENQATGVMDRLGLSWSELRQVNPSLIMLSMPGFGAEGPWSSYRAYGSTVEQSAGLPHLTGRPEDPPVQSHIAYGDACGGLHAAAALLTALFHRKRTGQGQRIDLAQVEGMLQLGLHGPVHQALKGAPPPRLGNRHPVFAPHGCFPCAGEDQWLAVALTDDAAWPALARRIGRGDLADDPALASADGRRARENDIEAALAAWTRPRDAREAMEALQSDGVAAGLVQRSRDLLTDPIFEARGFWATVDRAHVGPTPHPLAPYTIDGERPAIRRPAPLLGEHTAPVLRDLLGLSEAEIGALEAEGIVALAPAPTAPDAS